MSKHQIVKSLRQEIRKINYAIDDKIIKGLPYTVESRRHRFLMSQLKRLEPKRNLLSRSFGFLNPFAV